MKSPFGRLCCENSFGGLFIVKNRHCVNLDVLIISLFC